MLAMQILMKWIDVGTIGYRHYSTLMGRMIDEQRVPYQGAVYQNTKENFRRNLQGILQQADIAGVPVMISELVSKVRDQPPFTSIESGEFPAADVVYQQANQQVVDGNYQRAKETYFRAKDLDALRFRAPEEFNDVIHQIAEEFSVPVVPMKHYFEQASPNGLVGENLMLEHLHPNVDGAHLMAAAFFDALRKHGFISREWNEVLIKSMAFYSGEWPVTELDRALGRLRVMHLMDNWPFSPLDAPGNAFEHYQPGSMAEELAYRDAKRELGFEQARIDLAKYMNHKNSLRWRCLNIAH